MKLPRLFVPLLPIALFLLAVLPLAVAGQAAVPAGTVFHLLAKV
jgi:hypothetical protein